MILAAQPDFRVVAEVSNGREAVEQGEKLQPALCVMDVSMPDLNGIEATRRLLKVSPRTRVVAVSMHKDSVYVREILRAGAKGYVLKGVAGRELRSILKSVHRGETYVAPSLAFGMIRGLTRQRPVDPFAELTAREREVVELVASGLSNAEIGGRLGLAEKTVKHYMTAILAKVDVGSRVELALMAYKAGLAPATDETRGE